MHHLDGLDVETEKAVLRPARQVEVSERETPFVLRGAGKHRLHQTKHALARAHRADDGEQLLPAGVELGCQGGGTAGPRNGWPCRWLSTTPSMTLGLMP